jgi:formate/nitrite transporter FocA (FNT family)
MCNHSYTTYFHACTHLTMLNVNRFLIPLGILMGAPVTWGAFFMQNLLPVTLGNIVGGVLGVTGSYAVTYGGLDAQLPEPAL